MTSPRDNFLPKNILFPTIIGLLFFGAIYFFSKTSLISKKPTCWKRTFYKHIGEVEHCMFTSRICWCVRVCARPFPLSCADFILLCLGYKLNKMHNNDICAVMSFHFYGVTRHFMAPGRTHELLAEQSHGPKAMSCPRIDGRTDRHQKQLQQKNSQ